MNKFHYKIFFVCALLIVTSTYSISTKAVSARNLFKQKAENFSRVNYTINDNWGFAFADDQNSGKINSADDKWQQVNLPHTWNAQDAFDDTPDYRRGASWYRKNLQLNSELKNKRIFLYFEGANQTLKFM